MNTRYSFVAMFLVAALATAAAPATADTLPAVARNDVRAATIVRAVGGPGTPTNDEPTLAVAEHERVEGGWKRD